MSDEIKIPGPPSAFTDLIDAAQSAEELEKTKKYYPLRPSAAGYCARKLAYDLMQYLGLASYEVEVKDPKTIRLLKLGSSIEYQTLRDYDLFTQRNPDYQIKYKQAVVTLFRLSTGRLIEGSIDLAVLHAEYGNGIGDVKSKKDKFSAAFKTDWDQSTDKFSKMKTLIHFSETGWYAPDLPAFLEELNDPFFADNFIQVNSYLCTEWAKERGMVFGFVQRENKNDSRHLEIRFAPSPELFEAFRDKCERVVQAVAKKKPELVKKDYVLGSSRCAFCIYQKNCWGSKDALKDYFKTFPKKEWPTDTNRMGEVGEELESIFETYSTAAHTIDSLEQAEEAIVKIMIDEGIEKVRLENGEIYFTKYLASKKPRAGFVLRRGKL